MSALELLQTVGSLFSVIGNPFMLWQEWRIHKTAEEAKETALSLSHTLDISKHCVTINRIKGELHAREYRVALILYDDVLGLLRGLREFLENGNKDDSKKQNFIRNLTAHIVALTIDVELLNKELEYRMNRIPQTSLVSHLNEVLETLTKIQSELMRS